MNVVVTLNEEIEVVKYNPEWPKLFVQEAQKIRAIFEPKRLLGIEHYGSTSVSGLYAKPIIDILIGLDGFYISEQEKSEFQKLGYVYIGKALATQRFFLRKRGMQKFNLAVVQHKGSCWNEGLLVREYLQNHVIEALEYAQIKKQAIRQGYLTAIDYSEFKRDFVMELVEKAKLWNEERGYKR
jgi:GrpB-like predicted nucleotidyltransferase (UPF0157 family)